MTKIERITAELVDTSNKLDLAVVPEVHMIWWVVRVHPWSDDEDYVAFADHLDDFDAAFKAALHAEAERLEWEDGEAPSCSDGKCILILIETNVRDLFVTVHLL